MNHRQKLVERLRRWVRPSTQPQRLPGDIEHPVVTDVAEAADALTAQQQRIEALEAALNRIAAWQDKQANEKLKSTGSYGGFDEPVSVKIARETLDQYRNEEHKQ